ncbi:MAG TPA: putative lipid II flippase FtsW [Acidimicrobiia bacterium]|jgi:cell division protein FtsW
MTGNVTSIAQARAAARLRDETSQVNNRLATAVLVVTVVLLVIGLGATLSASSTRGLTDAQDRFYYFKRQLLGLGIGTVTMIVLSRVPYRFHRRIAVPLYFLTAGALFLVLLIGDSRNGSRRWLDLGPISFQPSELAKLAVILSLAVMMEKKVGLLDSFGHFLAPVLFYVGGMALLIMAEPDLGTTITVGAAALGVLLASPAPLRYVAFSGGAAAGAAAILAMTADYRVSRITGFLDPWKDAAGAGYQLIQGYLALGTGGMFGVGLGASRARWYYLPNAHTDFIFAIIGEETGLLGGFVVIALFVTLALTGWAISSRAPDRFSRMVAAGITAWISFQALVNVGGVLGVIPITGIVLPFVSYGSTALIATMAAIGILVNIAQQGVNRSTA